MTMAGGSATGKGTTCDLTVLLPRDRGHRRQALCPLDGPHRRSVFRPAHDNRYLLVRLPERSRRLIPQGNANRRSSSRT